MCVCVCVCVCVRARAREHCVYGFFNDCLIIFLSFVCIHNEGTLFCLAIYQYNFCINRLCTYYCEERISLLSCLVDF